ncbi:hypothetical protein GGH19_003302 [Coemansia sp. RSA 1807]|nr:hypothetical protein LPJ69_000912 [Coemansia sp. RSA 1752]KAJ1791283.1 hypothetical protein LPJ62_001484 [Coemansia sp. RSA 2167]KAJ2257290.1 hypothetical protein GGH98_000948 [Coemansia sp. RSA 454]KAJ2575058.1 hypothetical protein GGH19_003302 [Coemansia sp. RSA 1807]
MSFTTSTALASKLPQAKDLSHLFVPTFRIHQKSPFKAVMGTPTLDMINMAGGVPHPSTFPLEQVQATVRAPSHAAPGRTGTLSLERTQANGSTESLNELLQYNDGRGMASYCRFLRQFTEQAHAPPYADWDVVASCGNTDSIAKAVSLFCQQGDHIIVEQYSFPGALSNLVFAKVKPVPVAMDIEGVDPVALDSLCSSWTGATLLRAIYVIPTGQNPTGATMSLARRKALYAVAQKHDLVIIEDDPYYFLQLGPMPETQDTTATDMNKLSLVPSLLSLDTDGRVIRLDSFSKILAPNLRCGWITAPAYIQDRMQILNESTILQPSGLTQGVISRLLNDTWGIEGWIEHLNALRAAYAARRNLFVTLARKHLAGLATFTVPTAGMFLWMRVDLGDAATDATAMPRLLDAMKKGGVMMAPDMPFRVANAAAAAAPERYLRAAFALAETDMFEPALERLARAIASIRGSELQDTQSVACAEPIETTAPAPIAVNSST